jgi:hypothetical protein
MTTPDTEVLRISGNVTLPKGDKSDFEDAFKILLKEWDYNWLGEIIPQDDPSGMRLYKVEDIELVKEQLQAYWKLADEWKIKEAENNRLTISLSEELEQERKKYEILKNAYDKVDDELSDYKYALQSVERDSYQKDLVIKSLRNKENGWKTFIKWCKGLWKKING